MVSYFSIEENFCLFIIGVENEDSFFTSQERQSIVWHLLYSLIMLQNQKINGIRFKVDQHSSSLLI